MRAHNGDNSLLSTPTNVSINPPSLPQGPSSNMLHRHQPPLKNNNVHNSSSNAAFSHNKSSPPSSSLKLPSALQKGFGLTSPGLQSLPPSATLLQTTTNDNTTISLDANNGGQSSPSLLVSSSTGLPLTALEAEYEINRYVATLHSFEMYQRPGYATEMEHMVPKQSTWAPPRLKRDRSYLLPILEAERRRKDAYAMTSSPIPEEAINRRKLNTLEQKTLQQRSAFVMALPRLAASSPEKMFGRSHNELDAKVEAQRRSRTSMEHLQKRPARQKRNRF